MKSCVSVLIAVLLTAVYLPETAGDIYTWKDENGVLHFTDSPNEKVLEQGESAFVTEKNPLPKVVFTDKDIVDEKPLRGFVTEKLLKKTEFHPPANSVYDHILNCRTKNVVKDVFDVNEYTTGGWTPLTLAVLNGCDNNVKYLIQKGADVNLKHTRGFTPLHLAIRIGDKEIVEMLVSAGADINYIIPTKDARLLFSQMEGTPLETAYSNNKEDILEFLISRGADHKIKNSEGKDLLAIVSKYRREKLEDLLRKYGHYVKERKVTLRTIMKAIYSNRIELRPKVTRYKTPNPDAVIQMINENPDLIFQKDSAGNTLLHEACGSNQVAIVKLLLEKGLNVNQRNSKGVTPLHRSCTIEIIQLLLRHGANINATTDYGSTLLHYLVKSHETTDLKTFQTAINAGCNKYKRDRDGKAAYDYAKEWKCDDKVLEALKLI